MEKIETFVNKLDKELVDYYRFARPISVNDIYRIIDVLSNNKIELSSFRLSNSDEQPSHFFRVFPTLKDLYTYPLDGVYIDDFGVSCIWDNKIFDLTFDLLRGQIITITSGDIDLEALLLQIEQACCG